MNFQRFVHTLIFLLLCGYCASSQDTILVYPSMADIIPKVAVAVNRNDQSMYEYRYSIENGQQSAQDIWIFMVAMRSEIASSRSPQAWRTSRAFRPGISTVLGGSNNPSQFISPGNILGGFLISSSGLPKIQTFYAVGRVEPPEGDFEIALGTNDIFNNSVQGRTVSPADPPARFIPLDFLDTLITMKDEAKRLGWISPGSISTFIDEHFEKARNHLSEDDRSAAVEYVQDLRDEVSSAGCRHYPDPGGSLTSEGCALLRFNIEYWLGQMGGE